MKIQTMSEHDDKTSGFQQGVKLQNNCETTHLSVTDTVFGDI